MSILITTNGNMIKTTMGTCTLVTTDITLLMLCKFNAARDAQWNSLIATLTSGSAADKWWMEKDTTNKINFSTDQVATAIATTTTVAADGWCLHGVTKAAGQVVPHYHRYKYSTNTWTHEAFNTSIGDSVAPSSSGFVEICGKFGAATDYFSGEFAMAAAAGFAISDAQFESLPFSLEAWFAIPNIRSLWMGDIFVGGANVTDIVGTTKESGSVVDGRGTSSVPLFSYGASVPYVNRVLGPPPQKARPVSTISAGSWTPIGAANLYDTINEVTASDTEYDQSSQSPASADVMEVAVTSLSDPGTSTGHIIRYRYVKDLLGGDRIDLTVRLMQGATEIAAWTHTDIQTITQAAQTLSGAQTDSITDYTNLRLRFEAVKV